MNGTTICGVRPHLISYACQPGVANSQKPQCSHALHCTHFSTKNKYITYLLVAYLTKLSVTHTVIYNVD
jgi:hypothetical protein